MRPQVHVILIPIMAFATAATSWSQQVGDSVVLREPQSTDFYGAGRAIEILAPIDGDLVAAGGSIDLQAEVTEDVIVAGQTITVNGPVGDDLRAAGGNINIKAPISGHLAAAGGTVTVDPSSRVEDWAWLAGGQVDIAGSVGSLRAVGETVIVSGVVRGDADISADHLQIKPGAVVEGNLFWRSRYEPEMSDEARIEGTIERKPSTDSDSGNGGWLGRIVLLLGVALALLLLHALLPRFASDVAQIALKKPWLALALGLAVVVVVPLTAIALLFSGIGWLLGLLVIVGYGLLLLLGGLLGVYVVGALGLWVLGRQETVSTRARVACLVGAVVVLWIVSLIPLLGGLATLLVFLAGVGGLSLAGWYRYRTV